jgi:hypothetical protein
VRLCSVPRASTTVSPSRSRVRSWIARILPSFALLSITIAAVAGPVVTSTRFCFAFAVATISTSL